MRRKLIYIKKNEYNKGENREQKTIYKYQVISGLIYLKKKQIFVQILPGVEVFDRIIISRNEFGRNSV